MDRCLDGDSDHPCSTIVLSQHAGKADFQLPEPWRGKSITHEFFLSSNPSIGDDRYARGSSADGEIWESRHLAFGGGTRPYILDAIQKTKADGSPDAAVPYLVVGPRSSARAAAGRHRRRGLRHHRGRALLIGARERRTRRSEDLLRPSHGKRLRRIAREGSRRVGQCRQGRALGSHAQLPEAAQGMNLGGKPRIVFFLPHPNERAIRNRWRRITVTKR